MTRSLGDYLGKQVGISSEPEIKKRRLKNDIRSLVMASDGLWEFFPVEEVTQVVAESYLSLNPQHMSQQLLERAVQKWKGVV